MSDLRAALLEAIAKQFIAGDGREYGGDWGNLQHRTEYLRIAQPFADAVLAVVTPEFELVRKEAGEKIAATIESALMGLPTQGR